MVNAIIPECYVDTCLVNILLEVSKNGVNHGKGNSTVANKMKDEFGDSFAVGIIDRDKREIEYVKEFNLWNQSLKNYLLLFKHPDKHHYIIQLCPESETWICNVASDLEINMEDDYDLPSVPRKLAKLSKDIDVANNEKFVRLFKEIKKRGIDNNYEPVVKLISWLIELKENTYYADVNKLKN